MKKIELSDHFGKKELLLYSLPAIGNMLAITSFQLVDGYFVSDLLGLNAFVAVNLVSPVFFILYAIGFMVGSGTSAQAAQYLGEGDAKTGREIFSMSLLVMTLAGILLGAVFAVLMPQIAPLIGAKAGNISYCVEYGRILLYFLPAFLINAAFQSLWITAEKSTLGFVISVIEGGLNIGLDWLFMAVYKMGVTGAALASSLASLFAAAFCVLYFCRKRKSELYFVRFPLSRVKELGQILFNGFSDLVDSVSGNITELVMNRLLVRYIGDPGVAAFGVYNYVTEIFMAIFYGVSSTAVTVVGYKCGAKQRKELDGLLKNGSQLMATVGVAMCALCFLLARPIARLYLDYDLDAMDITVHALKICSFAYLLTGLNIYISSFFTGLEDGLSSAIIALFSSLLAPLATAVLLPALFGGDALWYSVPLASVVTLLVALPLLRYRYYGRPEIAAPGKTE